MNRQCSFNIALLSVFAIAAAVSAPGFAATTATATASATVIRPISVVKGADLAFASFAADTAAGSTVTVATDNSRSFTGSALLGAGAPSAARFDVSGETSTTYAISYDPLTTLTKGADSMGISLFSTAAASATASGTLLATGTLSAASPGIQSVFVGATLTVAANQASGNYTGNIGVTVNYN